VREIWCGVSVAEVLVAIVIVTVGLLTLVGSWGQMSRMIGRGRHATLAATVAASRVERLRQISRSTSPPCTGAGWRSDSLVGTGVVESWQVLDAAGPFRRVQVIVRHRTPSGFATDTVATSLPC